MELSKKDGIKGMYPTQYSDDEDDEPRIDGLDEDLLDRLT